MPPNEETLKSLVQINSLPTSQVGYGVVSPCSTCKNQRDIETDGKPACPRRFLLRFAKERADSKHPLSGSYAPALLTGTEGTDKEGTDSLLNPVYSDDQGHILVWVAHLQDNMGVYDRDGKQIVGPLWAPKEQEIDQAYDTDHIHCNALPYVVRETESVYFQSGAYREWDAVEATKVLSFQLDAGLGDDSSNAEAVKVDGFARKVNLAFGFPRLPVEQDLHPRGT
jgi:hypothetical protein